MSTISLLQKGKSDELVLLFFPSTIGGLKKKIVQALGPEPIIVIDESAKGTETLVDLLLWTEQATGIGAFSLGCLGGFSAGCQRVRALRMAGAEFNAFLLIDGAHASYPPEDWQISYLKDLVARAREGRITLVITHTYIVTEPAYSSTAAVASLATGWDLPKPPRDPQFGMPIIHSDGRLAVYSMYSEPLDVAAHSLQANKWFPIVLDVHVRPLLEPGYEPGEHEDPAPQHPAPSVTPTQIVTASDGVLDIETDYLPRVVTGENGNGPPAALRAQAIAARTYLLRHMLDHPSLGTNANPVKNTDFFQVYAPRATAQCIEATKATAGIVATYSHELISANFVAGALRTTDGGIGGDPTKTEKWVTYNEGETGTFVQMTKIEGQRWQNRGCMGQNCANWLARHGYDHEKILRYFYGLDLELTDLRGASPAPRRPQGPQRPSPSRPVPGPALGQRGSETGSNGGDGAAMVAIVASVAWALSR